MPEEIVKQCPFCGTHLEQLTDIPQMYQHPKNDCFFSDLIVQKTEIEKWNARKPMERIVEKLEKELRLAEKDKEKALCDPLCHPSQFDFAKGYVMGMHNAIETVKGSGEDE